VRLVNGLEPDNLCETMRSEWSADQCFHWHHYTCAPAGSGFTAAWTCTVAQSSPDGSILNGTCHLELAQDAGNASCSSDYTLSYKRFGSK
jgi:hypothetical protein